MSDTDETKPEEKAEQPQKILRLPRSGSATVRRWWMPRRSSTPISCGQWAYLSIAKIYNQNFNKPQDKIIKPTIGNFGGKKEKPSEKKKH